jgi:hypothetical protein
VVLYDNPSTGSGQGLSSTAYPGNSTCNDQLADDFVVPAGQAWNINEVDVGAISPIQEEAIGNGDAPSRVNVFIYPDAGGVPGTTALFTALDLPATNQPSYHVPLTGVPSLGSGTYWISVQQNGALCGEGRQTWDWELRTPLLPGSPGEAAGRDFFSESSCTEWAPISNGNCRDANEDTDLVFTLFGDLATPAAGGSSPATCLNLSAQAANFHPRKPKRPFQLGVRTKFTVPTPSSVELDATLGFNGQSASLGHHAFGDLGVRKLRFALPSAAQGLQHGDKVTLSMHAVITPINKCAGAATQDLTVKTRVVNVQTTLLLP